MTINKTFKEIIKIKDLAYLNDLGCEIIEYYPNNNTLSGRVYVTGAYHSSKTDEVKLISEDVEFLFEFDNDDFYVEDIECIDFNYTVLEGVGIDILFTIKLDVDIQQTVDLLDESCMSETDDNNDDTIDEVRNCNNNSYQEELESIKDEINKKVDQKLSDKLEIVNDNIPQNEVVFRSIKDEESLIKVVYFNEEKELNEIAENNNVSIDYLFKTNKKTDFNNKKRVIIKYGK